jgi:hypothetical protein
MTVKRNLKVANSSRIHKVEGTPQEVKVGFPLSMVIKLPSSNVGRFLKSPSANDTL